MDKQFRDIHIVRHAAPINQYAGAWSVVEHEVRRFDDVRSLTYRKAYVITSKIRVSFPGITATPSSSVNGFNNYPIIVQLTAQPSSLPLSEPTRLELVDYFPRTVNSSVNAVQNTGIASALTTTRQHSSGSSLSQTNSYTIGVNAGMSGEVPSFGGSYERSHSETSSRETSDASGLDRSRSLEAGTSNSMSVLDWSSYSQPNYGTRQVGWTWSQEFPLNALDYQLVATEAQDGDGYPIDGSDVGSVVNGTMLLPPSRLALFGVDFVCTSTWIYAPDGADDVRFAPSIEATVALTTGSHYFQSQGNEVDDDASASVLLFKMVDGPTVTLDTFPLDCVALALDPILCEGHDNGAAVGFVNPDVSTTANGATEFICTSAANTLSVAAIGFDTPSSMDCALSARLSASMSAKLIAQFKIVDSLNDYTLIMKGWVEAGVSASLRITINGQPLQIVRHVDWNQNGSGTDNLTTVILRYTEYSSNEYVDYLRKGLNTIEIFIEQTAPQAAESKFVVRSLVIA